MRGSDGIMACWLGRVTKALVARTSDFVVQLGFKTLIVWMMETASIIEKMMTRLICKSCLCSMATSA